MKTSNIFLIAIGLLILATLVFTNMALKAEFEKGSHKNRFYNHKTREIADAKNISISVPGYIRVSVEESDSNLIKYPGGWDQYINVTVQGDSLRLNIREDVSNSYRGDTMHVMLKDPHSISMIDRGRLNIAGLQQQQLKVTLKKNAYAELTNTTIDSLKITGQGNSLALVKEDNNIGFLDLFLEDQAKFTAGNSGFSGLKTQVGASARVELSGRSLDSFMKNNAMIEK